MQHAISVSVVLNEFDVAEDEGTALEVFVYKRNAVAAKSTLGVCKDVIDVYLPRRSIVHTTHSRQQINKYANKHNKPNKKKNNIRITLLRPQKDRTVVAR